MTQIRYINLQIHII